MPPATPADGHSQRDGLTRSSCCYTLRAHFATSSFPRCLRRKRLKIEDASFHSLRHTAASWLGMKGVPLYDIGQILGHKTPRMTSRYAHLSPAYAANAVSKIGDAFNRKTLENGE